MIEQTDLVVNEWIYLTPSNLSEAEEIITSTITLDVMKRRAKSKKGIACRFSCRFIKGNETILSYVAEDSYVIDLADKIDRQELLNMLRNSYSKFKEKFEIRKLGTVLQNKSISPLEETKISLDAILPLLD